jgi:hypothetical protein
MDVFPFWHAKNSLDKSRDLSKGETFW